MDNCKHVVYSPSVTATTPGCADVTFVTRADWGANESKAGCCDLLKVPTPKMFIKHSSRGRCNTMEECIPLVKEIQVLHMETNGKETNPH